MSNDPELLEQALRELEAFARDPHRDRLVEKFKWKESRQLSELLGKALQNHAGSSQRQQRVASLPVPAGLVHPG
jgi:predicted amidophosphoribosyltransferase